MTIPQYSVKVLINMFSLNKTYSIWCLWICWFTFCHAVQVIRVTDVKCIPADENTFVKITKCFTKPISRVISETTFNITLLQEVTAASVKLQFRKKSNGKYNPYFHGDVLIDACQFLKNRAISPIANYIFSAMEDFTNMNHSCPFKDFLVMDRHRVDMKKFKWIPLPPGDYVINGHFILNGKKQFDVGVYFTFSE